MTMLPRVRAEKAAAKLSSQQPLEPLLTIKEFAAILNASPKTVRRKIEARELAVIRDGRIVRISPEDARRYILQHRHG